MPADPTDVEGFIPRPPEWPWQETRLARRTRIAHLYRDTLHQTDPDACTQLDQLLDKYNQHWITGNKPPLNPDEPMTAKEISDWLDIAINGITNRIAARNIQPVGKRNGRKTYRLTDFTSNLITSL